MSDDFEESIHGQDIEEILNFVRGSIAKHTDEAAGEESSDNLPFPVEEENNEQESERGNTNIDSIESVPIEDDALEENTDYNDSYVDFEYRYSQNEDVINID